MEINENTEMKKPVNVSYSYQIPPETYDLIIVDEPQIYIWCGEMCLIILTLQWLVLLRHQRKQLLVF